MEALQDKVLDLLDGSGLEEEVLCDFTLAEQNEATVAKGVTPASSCDYIPVVKKSVTYIVVGLIVNDRGEVLMMQEAKKSCAGQWYLPAGRMEPGENIVEACKREVLEETGLDVNLTTLLMMETASGSWFRFVLTGDVIGGVLKTPAQADSESLQAKWVDDLQNLTLRCNDIVDVINKGRAYHEQKKHSTPWHGRILPALQPHSKLLMRLVICIKQRANNRLHVLLSEKTHVHLPVCEIYPSRNLHSTLRKFMIEIFGADLPLDSHKPHGLLSIEHLGQPAGQHDGVLLNILVSFRVPLEQVYPIDKYSWNVVSKELEEKLTRRIPKNMTIPLQVIR